MSVASSSAFLLEDRKAAREGDKDWQQHEAQLGTGAGYVPSHTPKYTQPGLPPLYPTPSTSTSYYGTTPESGRTLALERRSPRLATLGSSPAHPTLLPMHSSTSSTGEPPATAVTFLPQPAHHSAHHASVMGLVGICPSDPRVEQRLQAVLQEALHGPLAAGSIAGGVGGAKPAAPGAAAGEPSAATAQTGGLSSAFAHASTATAATAALQEPQAAQPAAVAGPARGAFNVPWGYGTLTARDILTGARGPRHVAMLMAAQQQQLQAQPQPQQPAAAAGGTSGAVELQQRPNVHAHSSSADPAQASGLAEASAQASQPHTPRAESPAVHAVATAGLSNPASQPGTPASQHHAASIAAFSAHEPQPSQHPNLSTTHAVPGAQPAAAGPGSRLAYTSAFASAGHAAHIAAGAHTAHAPSPSHAHEPTPSSSVRLTAADSPFKPASHEAAPAPQAGATYAGQGLAARALAMDSATDSAQMLSSAVSVAKHARQSSGGLSSVSSRGYEHQLPLGPHDPARTSSLHEYTNALAERGSLVGSRLTPQSTLSNGYSARLSGQYTQGMSTGEEGLGMADGLYANNNPLYGNASLRSTPRGPSLVGAAPPSLTPVSAAGGDARGSLVGSRSQPRALDYENDDDALL